MSTARLAELLGRLAIALSAGIDLRRAWASETDRSPRRWQPTMAVIRDMLASGEPLSQAMRAVGAVFPPLVIGMTAVSAKTGHGPEVFRELVRVLDRRVRTVRSRVPGLNAAASGAVFLTQVVYRRTVNVKPRLVFALASPPVGTR